MSTDRKQTELAELLKLRQGAHFQKMDLHTHSPASECSNYELPPELKNLLPGKSNTVRLKFLTQLRDETDTHKIVTEYEIIKNKFDHLDKPPELDKDALKKIADVWLRDMNCYEKTSELKIPESLKREQEKKRDDCLKLAIGDIKNYLTSLFWPEDFVLRCYIEDLQLVAITDHNHPGYIVPRLPELGTWFDAANKVNQHYRQRIGNNNSNEIRALISKRLDDASHTLADANFDVRLKSNQKNDECHKDDKPEKDKQWRINYVNQKKSFWNDPGRPVRMLHIIPGTEITVSNIHLLALFPPHWYIHNRIAAILQDIGIPEDQWGCAYLAAATASVQQTIDLVDKAGGIAIPAHANSSFKGLLRLFREGLALTKVIDHPALLALEITEGSKVSKKGDTTNTLKWLDENSSRKGLHKFICFTKGSDSHECRLEFNNRGGDLGERYTNIKMELRSNDTPDEIFTALRLALLSGQNRIVEFPVENGYLYDSIDKDSICLAKDKREKLLEDLTDRPEIIGISVAGKTSYMRKQQVRFNPYLNCLIGNGGKSAVLRHVGYAFGAMDFMESTPLSWLPETVRVYWRENGETYCVERSGKQQKAADAAVQVWKQNADQTWAPIDNTILSDKVTVWPPEGQMDSFGSIKNEDDFIKELLNNLHYNDGSDTRPLLINQPRELFNSHRLFNAVLADPRIKTRQIIWSTGSVNVPTGLDAEKVIVTEEMPGADSMQILCAGDLHEEEIRTQILDHMEGGKQGFVRRAAMYGL